MYYASLSKEVQDILKSAIAEACASGNEFVASEHVLIAIAKNPSERLRQYNMNPDRIRDEAYKLDPAGQKPRALSNLPFSPLLERVLQSVMQRQGSVEDVFYDLLADDDSLVYRILGNMDYNVTDMLAKRMGTRQ